VWEGRQDQTNEVKEGGSALVRGGPGCVTQGKGGAGGKKVQNKVPTPQGAKERESFKRKGKERGEKWGSSLCNVEPRQGDQIRGKNRGLKGGERGKKVNSRLTIKLVEIRKQPEGGGGERKHALQIKERKKNVQTWSKKEGVKFGKGRKEIRITRRVL